MHTIHCSSIENIIWNEHERSITPFVLASDIHVWSIRISPNLDLINEFENILSADEHARGVRYHQEKDRQRFLVSRIALRKLLARYANQLPAEIKFSKSTNKKPFIQNVDSLKLHYNTSHSGDVILIAIADSEVGVDVEKMDADFSYKEILLQNFSNEEIQFIQRPENFYLLWTRKEALLKATGKGIDNDLQFVPSLDGSHSIDPAITDSDKNWDVKSFSADKNYIGSVAYHSNERSLRFYDVDSIMLKRFSI